MHGRACRDSHADTPHDPRPPAEPEENERDGNLLQHPGAVEEQIERIVADARTGVESRRLLQLQPEGEVVFDAQSGLMRSARLTIDKELKNHQGEGTSYRFQRTYVEQYVGDK